MIPSSPLLPCLILLAARLTLAPAPAHAADAAHPTVVELFQSQGCSSCPPANRNVMAIAGRPDILVLSWQVTYWDQLGWPDSFARPAFTARQYEYARGLGHDGVFTPQVVVNGRGDTVGSDAAALADLLRRADRGTGGPSLRITTLGTIGGIVRVGAAAGSGSVLLVRYDPHILRVHVLRGENGGATLPHLDVVRDIVRLGDWAGRAATFPLPPATTPGLAEAILVQHGPGGPILAATRTPGG